MKLRDKVDKVKDTIAAPHKAVIVATFAFVMAFIALFISWGVRHGS